MKLLIGRHRSGALAQKAKEVFSFNHGVVMMRNTRGIIKKDESEMTAGASYRISAVSPH